MSIHICGSVAFDRILNFPGLFEDYIMPDKLHMINVSFPIDRVDEKHGGVATNIAYNLHLLGEKSSIYASVGLDFRGNMQKKFESMNVNLDGIVIYDDQFTACCYITSDSKGNQINGFNLAALGNDLDEKHYPKFEKGDLAITSPTNYNDMLNFSLYAKKSGADLMYDPGQNTPSISKESHLACIEGAKFLIGNDYEMEQIMRMTDCAKGEILEKVEYMITTLGENGCQIATKEKEINIPAPKAGEVVDPTGGGDSLRAGLLFALSKGLDVETGIKLGSICAVYCIEKYGPQEHSFTCEEFRARYEENYGAFPL